MKISFPLSNFTRAALNPVRLLPKVDKPKAKLIGGVVLPFLVSFSPLNIQPELRVTAFALSSVNLRLTCLDRSDKT